MIKLNKLTPEANFSKIGFAKSPGKESSGILYSIMLNDPKPIQWCFKKVHYDK
jgi:hypothetical protein